MSDIDWTKLRTETLGDFTLAALPTTIKFPALPHAVTLYLQKAGKPQADLRELAQIIETDTGLTLELLRYVNSTYIGLRNKARNVLQALTFLGQRQSKLFLISIGMQASIQAKQSKLINQQCFWNASLQKAIFAKEVAQLLNTDGEVAFAGALLQDYLLPVLTNELYPAYLKFTETRDHQPDEMAEYEQAAFGWDHAKAGACLATRWHLPDDLVCCVLFHHHGIRLLADPVLNRTPLAAVALSALLPDLLRQSYAGLEQLQFLETKWPAFQLGQLVEIVDAKHAELGLGVQNDFPLSRRCKAILEPELVAS